MKKTSKQIKNATVVITGASSEFGLCTALELAEKGAKVVICSRRKDLIEPLAQKIKHRGGEALAVTADAGNPIDVEHLAQKTIETYGRIDVWINNVGIGALGYFWDIPLDVHARIVDVNLKRLIYGAHVALREFVKQDGGTLINVGSTDNEIPMDSQNTYAAAKAAVLSLSQSLNEELRLSGHSETIRVATLMS